MHTFTHLLRDATAGIGSGYFLLNIAGDSPRFRERVYCYELYHQIRSRWPDGCPFVLNGEVDKAAHPILTWLGASRTKPDLLIHQPGDMDGNYAIVEVKSVKASAQGIRKDINTLSLFCRNVGYRRAIYLIYGSSMDERLVNRLHKIAASIELLARIEVWVHAAPGYPATHELTLGD